MARFFGRTSVPEELRVPWGPWLALLVFIMVWLGLPVIIILAARELAPYLPPLAWLYHGLLNDNIYAIFIEDIIDTIAGFGLIGYILKRHHVGLPMVGWRSFNWKRALLLFVIVFFAFTIGIGILLAIVTYLVPGFNADQTQTNDFTGNVAVSHPLVALLALVIIPPIIEETTFRGFLFPAFSRRFGVLFGAVMSSILFGFAHLQANVSVYTWLLGMLLCWLYVRTKSIFPGMVLHMLNNALALYVATGTK